MDTGPINDTLSLITRVMKLGKKATNVEYEEVIQAAREAILQQKEINLNLRDENRTLKEKLAMTDEYVLEKSVYWEKEDVERDQPYCPACYATGKKIPLQRLWSKRVKTQTLWLCPDKNCNVAYNPWDHDEESNTAEAMESPVWY